MAGEGEQFKKELPQAMLGGLPKPDYKLNKDRNTEAIKLLGAGNAAGLFAIASLLTSEKVASLPIAHLALNCAHSCSSLAYLHLCIRFGASICGRPSLKMSCPRTCMRKRPRLGFKTKPTPCSAGYTAWRDIGKPARLFHRYSL